jgi:hypothetical protein
MSRDGWGRTVGASRLADRLDAFPVPVVPTGVCPRCMLRVPVTRDGRTAKHWEARTVYAPFACCEGSGEAAGLIMIIQL